ADAGYGSEQNYNYIENKLTAQALIPYGMFEKEQTRSYRRDASKIMNWDYDPIKDYYTDEHGIKFYFIREGHRKDKSGFVRNLRTYRALDYDDPEGYFYAHTPGGNLRQININP
ncbi:IS1182 family transposase, partial [Lactobacillus sp. CC-MHH1034]|nr:IS1182 family transposase [Agrilactobacillus fermenti]